MEEIIRYKKLIEDAINRYEAGKSPKNLYDPIRYFLQLGGKRIRPTLVLMGYGVYHPQVERALNQALAIELFHNFSLIHDDIMDRADLRRGQSTVHKKWNEPVAILSGDLMLIKAYELLCDAPSSSLPAILEAFNKMAIEVCEGQQMDMDFEHLQIVHEDEYIEMIRKKTSVLIGAAIQIGALRAGADPNQAALLYEFGMNIGLAFQLLDDYLDVFGQSDKTGKVEGGDILNGKKTLLYLHSLHNATDKQRNVLLNIYDVQSTLNDADKVRLAREIFRATGSDAYLYDKAQSYYQIGTNLLKTAEFTKESIRPLLALADYLMHRDH